MSGRAVSTFPLFQGERVTHKRDISLYLSIVCVRRLVNGLQNFLQTDLLRSPCRHCEREFERQTRLREKRDF